MLLLSMAARNAARNVTRTGLTTLIVVAGTAFLVIALSWMNGVFNTLQGTAAAASGHVRVADPDYVAREDLMPLYENIPDSAPLVAAIAAIPGVNGAYPRVATGVTLTVGDEIGDVFGLAVGAPPAYYTEVLDLDAHLVEGRLAVTDREVTLGASLAERTGARVGQEVRVFGQTQDGAMSSIKGEVVGVVRAGNAIIDQQVYLSLDRARYLVDIPDGATEIVVFGDDRDGAERLAAAVAAEAPGLSVQAWSQREPWRGFFTIAGYIRGWMQAIIVFITALGVWNTMMMSVLERTAEIGVMRAMGLSRLGAVVLFVVEALAIAVIGGLIGVALGALPAYYVLEQRGITLGATIVQNVNLPFHTTMHGDFTPQIAAQGFLLALAMALVGSAPPAWRAAAIQPVEAMRARR